MDKRTKSAALAALAKSAAEIAADIAATTSDAAAHGQGTGYDNLLIGSIMPAEQDLEALRSLFGAMHALHQMKVA
jgi:hypothetical protein